MSFLSEPRRAFDVGQEFTLNGLRFRVRRGRKAPNDLVLDVHTDQGWQAVKMALSCFLADFHNQVEDVLFPKETGRKGGGYFFEALRRSTKNGWQHEAQIIESERYLAHVRVPAQPRLFDWEKEGVFSDRDL